VVREEKLTVKTISVSRPQTRVFAQAVVVVGDEDGRKGRVERLERRICVTVGRTCLSRGELCVSEEEGERIASKASRARSAIGLLARKAIEQNSPCRVDFRQVDRLGQGSWGYLSDVGKDE
jgi:hypothetical protein